MITRRAFLTGLITTTALVAAPIALMSEADRHAQILALVESKTNKLVEDFARLYSEAIYADGTTRNDNFGLASLLDSKTLKEVRSAPEYEWVKVKHEVWS